MACGNLSWLVASGLRATGPGRRRLHRELCSACTNYTAFVQLASLNEPSATVTVQIVRIFADTARVQLGRFDAQRTPGQRLSAASRRPKRVATRWRPAHAAGTHPATSLPTRPA